MKTKRYLFFAAIAATFITQSLNAKIWRVNNRSNYNGTMLWGNNFGGTEDYPVFAQINQAATIAAPGDTLYVEGSTSIYNGVTITKKLVIIGTGYFLTDNPKTSFNTLESRISQLIFNSGSEGSQVIGLNIVVNGLGTEGTVHTNVNGLTIKRCRLENGVQFASGLTDVYILENFFADNWTSNSLATDGLGSFVPPTEIIFNNNICQKTLLWGTPINNPTTLWPILQCNNNVFDGPTNTLNLAFNTSEFKNNILKPSNATVNIAASEGVIQYNIGTQSTQFGTADNNLVVALINTLFVTSSSPDGAYQIAQGSQASNSGSDGTDRGAFGGAAVTSRYTLSGLAAIPVVYRIDIPTATQSDISVRIQARTIK